MPRLLYQTSKLTTDLDGFRVEFNELDSRADIVLDRPPFNLVSAVQAAQMCALFEALEVDPAVRVIVVRGSGEHFSRGSDFEELLDDPADDVSQFAWNLSAPIRCSKPVIAETRGYCFGAGFELALACDFRIATETSLYALTAQRKGRVPDFSGALRLGKLVGSGRMKDIIMRARLIRGVQAYDWGIATEFTADSELESATDALLRELLTFSPLSQRAAKKLLNAVDDMSLHRESGIELISALPPAHAHSRGLRNGPHDEQRLRTVTTNA